MCKRAMRKLNKRSHKKHRNVKRVKRTLKKQSGGDSDMSAILLGLLDERYITLPTTRCIEDKASLQIFLNSVTGLELFHLIGKNESYVDSNTLNQIIVDNGYNSSDMFKELGSLTKSPAALKMLSNFTVNCFNLTSGLESKQSISFI